jgi:hypothetical protein
MIEPGRSFNVAALVDSGHLHFGTTVALCDCELLEMNHKEFLFAIQELPMFGLETLHDPEQHLQRIKEHVGDRKSWRCWQSRLSITSIVACK